MAEAGSETAEAGGNGYRALLRLPSQRRLAAMALPADLADWLDYAAVLALLVFAWGEGPIVLAFFALALSLPYVLIGPLLALLVDRSPIRTVLILSNAGRALATIGLVFSGSTVLVLALVFVRSTVDSAFTPARQAAIQSITPKPLLSSANGLHQAINQITKIVGPALGGLLLAVVSAKTVFAFNAGLSILAALLAAGVMIGPRPADPHTTPDGFFKRATAGFAEFGRNRLLRLALIFSATGYAAIYLYDALIPLLTENLGFDATIFGFAVSVSGVGGLVGALIAGRMHRVRPLTMMGAAAAIGGSLTAIIGAAALAGWQLGVAVFLGAMALMGGAYVFSTVPYRTIIQAETPEDRIARVYAAGESVTITVMMAAPFIGGLVARQLGTGAAFVAGGVILVLVGSATFLTDRRAANKS